MSPGGKATTRVLVVGCGQICDAHVQEARRAGAEVVAVCDASPAMAEQAAARLAVPAAHADLAEALATYHPDVVHVTTPPQTHLAVAVRALEHGAHVYVEKPATLDAREAAVLSDVARERGLLVCPGHNLLFDPAVRRLRELVDNGVLGEVVHAQAVMGYDLAGPFGALALSDPDHWVHRLPGGLAHNNLPHPLSLVLPFVGPAPVVVAQGRRLRPERHGDARDRFHDELRVLLEGPRATAAIFFSCRIRPVQLSLELYGTRRAAAASLEARTVRVTEGSPLPGPFQKVDWARREARAATGEALRRAGDLLRARLHYFEGMRALFRAFHRAARGEAPPPEPVAQMLPAAEVLDRVFERCRAAEERAA
ncbi:MAG TPA: Gfo/Idh/MocA family oxidoreductase [Anaeromyxobacter sp.]|nr:Gfo/Idh/MocA family oxidoreductase [Anaeromyxobacter sp.]